MSMDGLCPDDPAVFKSNVFTVLREIFTFYRAVSYYNVFGCVSRQNISEDSLTNNKLFIRMNTEILELF